MGIIYLLEVGDFYKIGYTKNKVEHRVKQLQTGTPEQIYIRDTFITSNGMKVERALHNVLSHKRVLGEFFDLTLEDINNFQNTCKKFEEGINYIKKQSII